MRRRRNEQALDERAGRGHGRDARRGAPAVAQQMETATPPGDRWTDQGRAVSLDRLDGRQRHRGRHQVGRRRPGPGRSEGSVVRRDARGRCREGPLRHRLQRPVRARLAGQQGGRHQDRRHQRQRAARDPALLPPGRVAVRHVVLGRAAAPGRRARGRLSLHLHAHRDRRAPRPDRRWQRELGRPADRLAHRAGPHRPLGDHRRGQPRRLRGRLGLHLERPGLCRLPVQPVRPADHAARRLPRAAIRTTTTTTSNGT